MTVKIKIQVDLGLIPTFSIRLLEVGIKEKMLFMGLCNLIVAQ